MSSNNQTTLNYWLFRTNLFFIKNNNLLRNNRRDGLRTHNWKTNHEIAYGYFVGDWGKFITWEAGKWIILFGKQWGCDGLGIKIVIRIPFINSRVIFILKTNKIPKTLIKYNKGNKYQHSKTTK